MATLKDLKELGDCQLVALDLTEARKYFERSAAAAHHYIFGGCNKEDIEMQQIYDLHLAATLLEALYQHLSRNEQERVSHMVSAATSALAYTLRKLEQEATEKCKCSSLIQIQPTPQDTCAMRISE